MQPRIEEIEQSGSCELLTICIFEILNAADWTSCKSGHGCELLTICIFEILNAANRERKTIVWQLWIAYNLYLWNIECSEITLADE